MVPGRSVGSWALCGFLGYLCVHGRFLLVPGLCLDSWAISVCIGAPSGYFSTPSGCLWALWVPGHSSIAAMKNRCYLNLSKFGYIYNNSSIFRFLGYLCVHGCSLRVPGGCLGTWALFHCSNEEPLLFRNGRVMIYIYIYKFFDSISKILGVSDD